MSEAGWTGPSARARTRTTSKTNKKKPNVSCCFEMYFTLVSHEKDEKKKRQKGKYTKIKQVNPYMGHIFAMITIQRRT